LTKIEQGSEIVISDFRKQLAAVVPEMAGAAYEQSRHLSILDADGSTHPPHNYLGVAATFAKFKTDFLPLSPLIDPRGRRISILQNNYPKLLNLAVKAGKSPQKAHTIIEDIESGRFVEADYVWEQDRLQNLFWIPDVIQDPDAIYRKRRGFGVVEAEEIYLKVYKKDSGSPVKVVFTQRVGGKKKNWVVITSYVTSRSTAKLYTDGEPLYSKTLVK
jgi:hypothetical protein